MAIEKGITEVADSEDEPMTSSPTPVSDEATQDKLCTIAPIPSQERQEACQEADCTHQARVQVNANTTADNAEGLDGHRNDASLNVDASSVGGTNGEFRDTAAAQYGEHVPAHIDIANAQIQHHNANRAADEETKSVEYVDQGEVIPVAQHLSMNDNEQQEPVQGDEQATAQALKSDFSIDDSAHTRQALPAMSPHTIMQASTTGLSNRVNLDSTNPDLHPVTAVHEHLSCSAIGKAEDPENSTYDSRTKVGACGPTARLEESVICMQTGTPLIHTDQGVQGDCGEPCSKTEEMPEITNQALDISAPAQPAYLTQSNSSAQPHAMSASVAPLKTPQELTLAELKTQKAALLASLGALPAIQVLMEETASSGAETDNDTDEPTEADIMSAANKIVKEHIKLLHEYNELKDVGQGLMGLIADQRGVRIVEVQEDFGIDAND